MEAKAGVYTTRTKGGTVYYKASITLRRRHISLGSYADPAVAHQAYLEAKALAALPQPPDPDGWPPEGALPLEKWVCLANFLRSGIYTPRPLYLRHRYFEYYLSAEEVLKFDMEDFLYYSSHKISRRGGHLFVADFGMQLRIGLRYGIRAYGVEGRDFCFANGDTLDYRRENLRIHNGWHGVYPQGGSGGPSYVCRIQVRGLWKVGVYAQALEAAAAYNKAALYLMERGLPRRICLNDLSELPPDRLEALYASVCLPRRILEYRA